MKELLTFLGASPEDVDKLRTASESLKDDPTLPFRKTQNGRFCLDSGSRRVSRLEFQPFVLSSEEDFVRHDSGELRRFHEIQNDLALNPALHALFALKFLLIHGMDTVHRPLLAYDSAQWICTLFNIRTTTDVSLLGEPALEGVHSDGVDHTMTTFLGCSNMTDDSATTFIHDMREKNAVRWNETSPELVVGTARHGDFLDTLLLVDHERKHSVSPVYTIDPDQPADRDMLIFFTRRPALKGHVSYPYDSMTAHRSLPMSADLPLLDLDSEREHVPVGS
ncbi:2OG-Fe dioxygenase family protein [Streptomyces sp. S465]|uniref:2OG-Fe dioxygenase family protein n=1 Tax=Streptomyces sp. S465 TaxID=2979468 RepID=UPI0022A87AC3|nr:2OG-Fe dioxygenase family protein [Streptomyces sp. S465]WAP57782.1 2OG-Fe dioxygenase family protein [Streptomyces sp. S465]